MYKWPTINSLGKSPFIAVRTFGMNVFKTSTHQEQLRSHQTSSKTHSDAKVLSTSSPYNK